ncbi:hypothetical protein SteCoe_32376 [Stentor coeruleus]|uniref:VTT domain-containing protein n=1 Tax=Stentor coeruleus TaxID=5963 RepID=A0A1R2AZ51_9CILI|nr:hypothetical protein SteCoe_32376 [Stentor coeruleus]
MEVKTSKWKLIIFGIIILIQISLFITFITNFKNIISEIEDTMKWTKQNPILSLSILVLLDIITIACLLPTPIFNFVVNYTSIYIYSLFPGAIIGFCLSLLAVIIGCVLSFLMAKFLLKSTVENYISKNHPNLKAIVKAVETQGFKVVLLMRLAPLPTALVNYALSITNIEIKDFVLGTFGCSIKIFVGLYAAGTIESLADGQDETTTLNIVMIIVGLLSLIVVVGWIGIKAKRELENIKEENYKEMSE